MNYRMMAQAPGGPDAIVRREWEPPLPGRGELLVRNEAIGINFIDVYHRSGLYPRPVPIALGSEGAGIVEAIGDDVREFAVGDRVAYLDSGNGTYATYGVALIERAVPVPSSLSSSTAAAALLKGCTVEMLVERCARIEPEHTVLVHAAAGGVGLMLVGWLKSVGARVIAHAGSAKKAELARSMGADEALHCPLQDLAGTIRDITDGRGVDVVFDGVGASSWQASLASAAKRGLIVSYGNASGPVPPFQPLELGRAGSLFLTRPSLFDYLEDGDAMRSAAARLFEQIGRGAVQVHIGAQLPLEQAADAHRLLEGRATTGSIVLTP